MELLEQIKENAKKQCKTIVLPEGTEERTIQAAVTPAVSQMCSRLLV